MRAIAVLDRPARRRHNRRDRLRKSVADTSVRIRPPPGNGADRIVDMLAEAMARRSRRSG